MDTTRKWWLPLVAAAIFLFPLGSFAQSTAGLITNNFTSAGAGGGINLLNTSIAYHSITWHLTGTASACTVALDTSTDGVTWSAGGAITGQTCTSNGTSTVANVVANYIRINVTALTISAGGSISVTWSGWIANPSSSGAVTGCSSSGGIGYEGGTANVLTCSANAVLTSAGDLTAVSVVGQGPVAQVEAFYPAGSAIPSATASVNTTAIQAALNSGKPVVTMRTPGTFVVNATLVAPQGAKVKLDLGTQGTTLQRAALQNTPMFENYNFNAYINFSNGYFNGGSSVTLSWLARQWVLVSWTAHGQTPGQSYVYCYGPSNPQALNGVFPVVPSPAWIANNLYVLGDRVVVNGFIQQVTTAGTAGASAPTWNNTPTGTTTDNTVTWTNEGAFTSANEFWYYTDHVPTGAQSGSSTCMPADTGLEITGGTLDANSQNQTSGMSNPVLYDTIVVGGAQNIYVHDIKCINTQNFCVEMGAVRDVVKERIETQCTASCSASVTQGPFHNVTDSNYHGQVQDDVVQAWPAQVTSFNGGWSHGDADGWKCWDISVYQSFGTAECVLWAQPPSVGTSYGISMCRLSGNPFTASAAVGAGATGAVVDDVEICGSKNLGYLGGAAQFNNGTVTYTLKVNRVNYHDFSYPTNSSPTGNLIEVNQDATIGELNIDNGDISSSVEDGALLYCNGTIDITNIRRVYMTTGSTSYIMSLPSGCNAPIVNVDETYVTGPTNGMIIDASANNTIFNLKGNYWSGPYGVNLNSGLTGAATVTGYGNQFDSMTNGAVYVGGSFHPIVDFNDTTLTNGSIYTGNGYGYPTYNSGFNGGSVQATNGVKSFLVFVGTGSAGSTGVINMPNAPSWNCWLNQYNGASVIGVSSVGSTTMTFTNYGTGFSATNWTNSTILLGHCDPR